MPSPVGLVELPTTTNADSSTGEDETDPGVVAAMPPTAAAVTTAAPLSMADGDSRRTPPATAPPGFGRPNVARCFPIAFPLHALCYSAKLPHVGGQAIP